MPKLKTNKAAKKRFKITASGKVLMSQTTRRHLLTDKRSVTKRKLRRWRELEPKYAKPIQRLIPYA